MAKVRFVGDVPHDVPELGRSVVPDEVVEVRDDLYKSRVWPESLWQLVKKSTSTDGE